MYKVLYRACRPEIFDEVIGQEHIVKILKNQLERDEVNHAYLFTGTRGTGKTTTARLLAKGLNCLAEFDRPCGECANCKSIAEGNFIDVIEIDAASYNGIDQVRELRESITYPPSIGRKKVYIIDEVHMMSNSAFNALLKTLEEPPEWAVLILATTDPQKLPRTILSRCMKLEFRRVSESIIKSHLEKICSQRNIDYDDGALSLLGKNGDGSVRDALTLLDQCISYDSQRIDRLNVLEALGIVDDRIYIDIVDAIRLYKVDHALMLIEKEFQRGKDPRQMIMGLLEHYRNLMLVKFMNRPEEFLNMSMENVQRVRPQAEEIDINEINRAIRELALVSFESKNSNQPRILLELVIVKLSSRPVETFLNCDGGEVIKTTKVLNGKIKNDDNSEIEFVSKSSKLDIEKDAISNNEIDIEEFDLEAGFSDIYKSSNFSSNVETPLVLENKEEGFRGSVVRLWADTLEEICKTMPQMNMLKSTSVAKGIENNNLIVQCTNKISENLIETNRELFNTILRAYAGINIGILVEGASFEKNGDRSTIEKLSSLLGHEVEKV